MKFVLGLILTLALAQWILAPYYYGPHFGGDFRIYLYGGEGWLYADWTRIYWQPFRWMPYELAWFIWFWLNVFSCMTLAYLTSTRIKHGCLIALAFTPVMWYNFGTGNVIPQLALFCLTPVGCLFAGTLKPYLWAFLLLHTFRDCPSPRVQAVVPKVRSALRAHTVADSQTQTLTTQENS
jgi:hypothetical protein